MDLANLLVLVPPALALAWLAHLLFRKELATQSLGKIVSYFIGVVIIFIAIAWIVDSFFIPWVNARLINSINSGEVQQSINIIEGVFDESFSNDTVLVPTPAPTPIILTNPTPVVVTPSGGVTQPQPSDGSSGEWPKQHVVQSGETLIGIGEKYGVPYEAIIQANGLSNWTIYPGQTLTIPAPTK